MKKEEIGWSSMEEVKAFMREHAPTELTNEL